MIYNRKTFSNFGKVKGNIKGLIFIATKIQSYVICIVQYFVCIVKLIFRTEKKALHNTLTKSVNLEIYNFLSEISNYSIKYSVILKCCMFFTMLTKQ